MAFYMALPWLAIGTKPSSDPTRTQMRFSVRTLQMITAGNAVAIPLLAKSPLVVSEIACVGTFAYLVAFFVRDAIRQKSEGHFWQLVFE